MRACGVLALLVVACLAADALGEDSMLRGAIGAATRGDDKPEDAAAASGAGESGASGESGAMSAEQAEKEADKQKSAMEKVQEAANNAKEAQKKLEESVAAHVDATKDTRTKSHVNGVHSDLTGDGIQNNFDTNKKAQEALENHNLLHLELQKAKREAGIALGNNGDPHAIQKQICMKRIKNGQKLAEKFSQIAHDKEAKARAAGNFLKEKLRKAHEASMAVKDQKNHMSVQFKLEVAKNATEAAKQAKDEANKAKLAADYAQDAADNAAEASKRCADECAGMMSPVKHLYAEKKPDDFKDLKPKQPADTTERPTAAERANQVMEAANAKLRKDINAKKTDTSHLGLSKEKDKPDSPAVTGMEQAEGASGATAGMFPGGESGQAAAGGSGANGAPAFRATEESLAPAAPPATVEMKSNTDSKVEQLQNQIKQLKASTSASDSLKTTPVTVTKTTVVEGDSGPGAPVPPAGESGASGAALEGASGTSEPAAPAAPVPAAVGASSDTKVKQTIKHEMTIELAQKKTGAAAMQKDGPAPAPKMTEISKADGKLQPGVAAAGDADKKPEEGDKKPEAADKKPEEGDKKPEAVEKKPDAVDKKPEAEEAPKPKKEAKDDTVPCVQSKPVVVEATQVPAVEKPCDKKDTKLELIRAGQKATPTIGQKTVSVNEALPMRFRQVPTAADQAENADGGSWSSSWGLTQKAGETISVSTPERHGDGFRKPKMVESLAAERGVTPLEEF